ncbi:tetratricopeptide repeat protein [Actinomadura sp. 9N215]|uniref:tetratricopeptide repeat protein n=1 Tax=Actinomadura sp. 9N215 TaxID=3375150 RepID=UPI0037909CDE
MSDGVPPQRQSPERDELAERMAAASGMEKVTILVDHLAPGTSQPSSAWVGELVSLIEDFGLSIPEIRRATTDLAWIARINAQPYLGDDDWTRVLRASNTRTARLCLVYIQGQRLRFDYRFEELRRRCLDWLTEFEDDALVRSLAAFAALGSRSSNGLNMFRRAVDAPDADGKSNQVCLTAIWFADHLPEQPQMMLRLADEMMARGQEDEVVYYRRATAYRKLRQFDEALFEIDRAIDGLGVGDVLRHEQFTQERRAIVLAQDLQRQIEQSAESVADAITRRVDERVAAASTELENRLNEASLRLAQRVDVAQEMVSSGLLKMVEILGLFVALVGFVVGSGSVVVKAHDFGERALAMSLVLGGSVIFFVLLRLVTSVGRRARANG